MKKSQVFGILFLFIISALAPISQGDVIKERPSIFFNRDKDFYVNSDSIPFYNGRDSWNQTFGGNSYDEGFSVQETNDGGYIIAGATLSYGAGNWDVWLIKTDFYGNEEWNTTFGGSGYDRSYSVQQTNDEGFILTGCTYSYGAGNWDVWLIKTDFYGNEEWNTTFGGSSDDWGYSVQQTYEGGYIITGYTDSYGQGLSDVWLIKTDINGAEEWQQTFGGSSNDRGYSVQQTNDDGYIITGYTVSYDSDYTGCDVWLIKTDSSGILEWHKTYGGSGIPNKFDIGYSVRQTKDSGYIIAGDTEIYFVAESDFLLIKTDSIGNEEWYQKFGGASSDRGRSVQQTIDGGYAVLGWISSYGPGDSDIYLIKTNSSGNYEWNYTFKFELNSSDWGYSVQQTNDGGYTIVGSTMPDGWGVLGESKSNPEEGTDVWLIRIPGENKPPRIPKINGPGKLKRNEVGTFTVSVIDPDDDQVYYFIDWDDGNIVEWDGPYLSGEEVEFNHSWIEKSLYVIRVQAKDINGLEGNTTGFVVQVPRTRTSHWMRFLDMFPVLQRILGFVR